MATDPKSKDQIFYLPLSERPPTKACTGLLDTYSHIPKDKLYSHIEAVVSLPLFNTSTFHLLTPTQRENAWNHYPYPSIGIWTFLDLGLSGNDLPKDDEERVQAYKTTYQSILSKLKNGGKFLDVGCMFAQDCRKLVFDGAPAESVYGTDLLGEYFEFGYELFNDTEVIPRDHFIAGDILAEKLPEGLEALKGKLDAIFNGQFLHVFSIEDQRKVGVRFVELLRPEKGVIVVGRCSGHVESGYRGGEVSRIPPLLLTYLPRSEYGFGNSMGLQIRLARGHADDVGSIPR